MMWQKSNTTFSELCCWGIGKKKHTPVTDWLKAPHLCTKEQCKQNLVDYLETELGRGADKSQLNCSTHHCPADPTTVHTWNIY